MTDEPKSEEASDSNGVAEKILFVIEHGVEHAIAVVAENNGVEGAGIAVLALPFEADNPGAVPKEGVIFMPEVTVFGSAPENTVGVHDLPDAPVVPVVVIDVNDLPDAPINVHDLPDAGTVGVFIGEVDDPGFVGSGTPVSDPGFGGPSNNPGGVGDPGFTGSQDPGSNPGTSDAPTTNSNDPVPEGNTDDPSPNNPDDP